MAANRRDLKSVEARTINAKKDVEKLKNELQSLLEQGIHQGNRHEKRSPQTSTTEKQPQNTLAFKESVPCKDSKTKNTETRDGPSSTKNKAYNVAEARDYMKKQRDKRSNLQKINAKHDAIQENIKKEKLKNLHAKAQELVKKNVRMGREKSPHTEHPLRLDKTVTKTISKVSVKRQDMQLRPEKKKSPHHSPRRENILNEPNYKKQLNQAFMESDHLAPKSHSDQVQINYNKAVSTTNVNGDKQPPLQTVQSDIVENVLINPELLHPHYKVDNTAKSLGRDEKNNSEFDIRNVQSKEYFPSKSQETQTSNYVGEFSPSRYAGDRYPCNFINSVQRKLKFTVDSPKSCADIGIQNSLSRYEIKGGETQDLVDNPVNPTITESQLSHRINSVFNIDHLSGLELQSGNHLKNITKRSTNTDNSESDTSKNIPELSSESLKSTRNVTRMDSLKLDGLKDLKLQSQNSNFAYSNNLLQDYNADTYTTEFLEEFTSSPNIETKSTTPSAVPIDTTHGNTFGKSLDTDHKVLSSEGVQTARLVTTSLNNESTTTSLTAPTVSLITKSHTANVSQNCTRNVTIRKSASSTNNTHDINTKFETEVGLLNDFNASLRQFVTAERAFEYLKTKNERIAANDNRLQDIDTQTSFRSNVTANNFLKQTNIEYSRGSDIMEKMNILEHSNMSSFQDDSYTTLEYDLNTSVTSISRFTVSNIENYNVSGLSLNICEQLIKDEDVRIQHLKAIIKIREQALLDRTKSELVWLEIQKKQFIETGKLEEASFLKKKQRGLILKHEQERNEMKHLKKSKEEESNKRKNNLKKQRKLIKRQLSTNDNLAKLKVNMQKRRHSGPLKVLQSCNEFLHSETVSTQKSNNEEILTSRSSSVLLTNESHLSFINVEKNCLPKQSSLNLNARRKLAIREAALQKRRQTTEDLLQWHENLLVEEKKIIELEAKAIKVINRECTEMDLTDTFEVGGANATGINADDAQCESEANYSSLFHSENVPLTVEDQIESTNISSISGLIHSFSKIGDEISQMSKQGEQLTCLEDDDQLDNIADRHENVITDHSHSIISNFVSTADLESKHSGSILENQHAGEEKADEVAVSTSNDTENGLESVNNVVLNEPKPNQNDTTPPICQESSQDISSCSTAQVSDEYVEEQISQEVDEESQLEQHQEKGIVEDLSVSNSSAIVDTTIEKSTLESKLEKLEEELEINGTSDEVMSAEVLPPEVTSPKLQDTSTNVFELEVSVTPECNESFDELLIPSKVFNQEAEDLFRKQLAIEQEIKHLEQQQSDTASCLYVREIPNKPPPPYSPPSSLLPKVQTIIPFDRKQINDLTDYASKVIFKALQTNNFHKLKFSEISFKLISNVEVPKMCGEFLFNICKDLAWEHYQQLENVNEFPWLNQIEKKSISRSQPFHRVALEKYLNDQLKELFGFKKPKLIENAIITWGKRKRDHVDEILVHETQKEESQWTNFDNDELIVQDILCHDLLKALVDETAVLFTKILDKKRRVM